MVQTSKESKKAFNFPQSCSVCQYQITPDQVMRTDWEVIRCPQCLAEVPFVPKKSPARSNTLSSRKTG